MPSSGSSASIIVFPPRRTIWPHDRGGGWQRQAGWFHFVGELLDETGDGVVKLPDEFQYWLHTRPQLVADEELLRAKGFRRPVDTTVAELILP
jgi:hypothetical protein